MSKTETFYHTQEKRGKKLLAPIPCDKDNAWLGEAIYYWLSEDDAIFWGNTSKRATGSFEIYRSEIEMEDVLDTVFNKEHYFFWIKQIEKAAKYFIIKVGSIPTLKELNDYFKEKGIWSDVAGIMFQDISKNPKHYMVKEFQYKKRIQLAVYNNKIITTFAHHFENDCV